MREGRHRLRPEQHEGARQPVRKDHAADDANETPAITDVAQLKRVYTARTPYTNTRKSTVQKQYDGRAGMNGARRENAGLSTVVQVGRRWETACRVSRPFASSLLPVPRGPLPSGNTPDPAGQ